MAPGAPEQRSSFCGFHTAETWLPGPGHPETCVTSVGRKDKHVQGGAAIRWPLMPALWSTLTRTRVSEPPPFPEPQVAAILLSSNGPVAYLGPGMGRLGRGAGGSRVGSGGGEVLALPSVDFQRELGNGSETNWDDLFTPKTTPRHILKSCNTYF